MIYTVFKTNEHIYPVSPHNILDCELIGHYNNLMLLIRALHRHGKINDSENRINLRERIYKSLVSNDRGIETFMVSVEESIIFINLEHSGFDDLIFDSIKKKLLRDEKINTLLL